MHVTSVMIAPELRLPGRIFRLLFPKIRSAVGFRRMEWLSRRSSTGRRPEGMQTAEIHIARRDGGTIRLMVYKPLKMGGELPLVLWIHGGGYVIGMPENDHAIYHRLMDAAPCVIVAPDYRLALDHPYPAALDDCYDALRWMQNQAEALGGRTDQIAVAGASAGGGLTAAVTLLARDRGEVQVAFQMPLYPMIDDRIQTASAVGNNAPVWDEVKTRTAWKLYLGGLTGEDVPQYAAPARATNLLGLPPTCTFIGTVDPFLDETRQYMQKLKDAGVPTAYEEFQGAFHGFEVLVPRCSISQRAYAFYTEWFAHAVQNYFAPQTR